MEDLKSRFTGRKVDARIFLAEAIRGERNFTDSDMTGCDLAAYPKQVEKFNQAVIDRCVPLDDPCYPDLIQCNWHDLDLEVLQVTVDRNLRNFQQERFYFTQANMSGFCAIGMWFPMADLRYTYLDSADLTESFLYEALFDESEAPSIQAECSDLREASFCGSRIQGANLSGSLMQGSRLIQSNFVNCNFTGANLDGSEMENTDFSGSDFSKASIMRVKGLRTANWGGVRFKRTRVKKEDVEAIKKKRDLDGLDSWTPEHRALRKGR